jgi:hypothetical protein
MNMNDEFKIEVDEWLPGNAGTPEIRETTAEISIKVKAYYVTELEDRRARSVRKTVRASAYVLATWLVANWWRLRWEPDRKQTTVNSQSLEWELSHELAASGGGYVWPPVMLSSDGYHMFVRCEGREKSTDESLSPIRYLNSFGESVDVSSFEVGVSNFVEQVLARLDASRLRHTSLHELWSEVRTERTKKPLEARRKLEALLGVDPDEEARLISGLLKWQDKVGKLALEEIAAASGTHDVETILSATAEAAKSVRIFSRISDYHKIKSLLADKGSISDSVPWKLAKEAAYVVREVWGLHMRPVGNRAIADRLNINESILSETHSDKPVTVGIRGPQEEQLKLLLRPTRQEQQRFDLARLIGDHIGVDSGDNWKPATHSMTARQKFQRAFAAEFLCPSDELYNRYKNEIFDIDDLDGKTLEIAREYQVSQWVVLNHLVNKDLLDASLWRDLGLHGAAYSFGY